MNPAELDRCESRPYFPAIHYLALHCDGAALRDRLRARPAWRGCDEAFIAGQVTYNRWLLDNATTAFDPPLTLVDTTNMTITETAESITAWTVPLWEAARLL
jgi:hypothetical protein